MHNCHHSDHYDIAYITSILGIDGNSIILAAFIAGLIISFTHCIGMCGPFALMQLNSRLCFIPNKDLSEKRKITKALLMPYYLGKAISYCCLTYLFFKVSRDINKVENFKELISSLLFIMALFLINLSLPDLFKISWFNSKVNKLSSLFSIFLKDLNYSFGIKGIFTGFVLGFIPCGALYSSLISISVLSSNLLVAILSTIAFAIATIPGLFLVSYMGSYYLAKYKKKLSWLYNIIMLFNAFILFRYAFMVWNNG